MTERMTAEEWYKRFKFPQKSFSRKDIQHILRNWRRDRIDLQAESDRRLVLLKRLEWIPDVDEEGLRYCPECGEYEENGHADGCELDAECNG